MNITSMNKILVFLVIVSCSVSCIRMRTEYSERTYTILDTPYSVKKQLYYNDYNSHDNRIVLTLYRNGVFADSLVWRAYDYPLDSGDELHLIFDEDSVYTEHGLYVEDSGLDSPVFVNLDNKQENSYYYYDEDEIPYRYGGKLGKKVLHCKRSKEAYSRCMKMGTDLYIRRHAGYRNENSRRIMGQDYGDFEYNGDDALRNIPFAYSGFVDKKPEFKGSSKPSKFEKWMQDKLSTLLDFGAMDGSNYWNAYFILTDEGMISEYYSHANMLVQENAIIKNVLSESTEFWTPGYKDGKPISTIIFLNFNMLEDHSVIVELIQ